MASEKNFHFSVVTNYKVLREINAASTKYIQFLIVISLFETLRKTFAFSVPILLTAETLKAESWRRKMQNLM